MSDFKNTMLELLQMHDDLRERLQRIAQLPIEEAELIKLMRSQIHRRARTMSTFLRVSQKAQEADAEKGVADDGWKSDPVVMADVAAAEEDAAAPEGQAGLPDSLRDVRRRNDRPT